MSQATLFPSRWGLLRQAFGEWWIPIFLSLLPVLILVWNGREEAAREEGERLSRLRQRCDRVGKKLREASELVFWLREGMSRLNRMAMKQGASARRNSEWWKSARSCIPKGMGKTRIWAFQNQGRFRAITAPGLETDFSDQFARLLHDVARPFERPAGNRTGEKEKAAELLDSRWVQRWRMILGTGITPELFFPSQRGLSFNVIFQGQPYVMIWDLVSGQGTTNIGLIMMYPLGESTSETGLQICVKNWASRSMLPAFLPMPIQEGGVVALPILHTLLCQGTLPNAVMKLQERMGIFPDDRGDYYDRTVRTLVPLFSRVFPLEPGGKRWGYLAPVEPTSGHVGLLVFRRLENRVSAMEKAGIVLMFFWVGIWGLWLCRILISGRVPSPGIHLELVIWLLVMVSMPMALSYGIGVRLSADYSANRLERLRQDLRQILRNVESGVVQVNQAISREIVSFWERPGLKRELMKPKMGESLCLDLAKRLEKKGFHVSATLLYRRNLPAVNLNLLGVPLATLRMIDELMTAEWNIVTGKESAEVARGRNVLTAGLSGSKGQGMLINVGKENQEMLRAWKIGEMHWYMYSLIWELDRQPMVHLNCLWSMEPHFEGYLEKAFDSQVRLNSAKGLSLGAYRIRGGRIQETSAATGEVAGRKDLFRLAEAALKQPLLLERPSHGDLVMAFSSRDLPGFVLLGSLSTESLAAAGFRFMLGLVMLMASLLLLATMVSVWLRRRMADPVVEMADALQEVGAGNLEVRVDDSRSDELGFAGHTVNTMTVWLRERLLLSRFVAPQVLDVVAGGDYRSAMEGENRQVAVLVSDIRSFTSLSESHPPAEIFKLLNQHMDRMTRVIQREGGVIDRFIGDAIQAVFYENSVSEPCSVRAIRAAGAMKLEHQRLNNERHTSGSFPYGIGIGIDTGIVAAGVIGDPGSRLDFTIIGEPVRNAGELEASSKQSRHTGIIVSESVRQEVGDQFPLELLGETKEVYELISITEPGEACSQTELSEKPSCTHSNDRIDFHEEIKTSTSDVGKASLGWILLFWAFPAFWFLGINLGEQWRVQDARLGDSRRHVEETLGVFEKRLDPMFQAGFWLQQQIQRLPMEPFSLERWQKVWASLRSILPNASFALLKPGEALPHKNSLHEIEAGYDERFFRVAAQSKSPDFPLGASETRKLWASLFFHDLLSLSLTEGEIRQPMSDGLYDWKTQILELSERFNAIGAHGFFDVVKKGYGDFQPFTIEKKRGGFLWLPLRKIEVEGLGPAEKSARTHGLMVFSPREDFSSLAGYQFLLENLRLRGLEGAVAWRDKTGWSNRTAKGFLGKNWFRGMMNRLKKNQNDSSETFSGIAEIPDGVIGWRHIVGAQEVLLVVGARNDMSSTGIKLTSGQNWIPLLVWVVGGLIWFLSRFVRNLSRKSLLFQMVGSFGLVILPCLILGFQLLEIFLQERSSRIERDRGAQLIEEMESMDSGVEAMGAYYCGFVQSYLAEKSQVEELRVAMKEDSPGKTRVNDPFWGQLVKVGEWRKVFIRNVLAAGTGSYVRGFMQAPMKIEGFRLLMEKNLQKMNPDLEQELSSEKSVRDSKAAMIGVQVDELIVSMRSMIPPEVHAAQVAAPRVLIRLGLQKEEEKFFYLQQLMIDGKPRGVVQFDWDDKPLVNLVMNEWGAYQTLVGSETRLETAYGSAPGWRFVPPYWKIYFEETNVVPASGSLPNVSLKQFACNNLQQLPVAQLSAEAYAARQARVRVINTSEGSRLIAALPGSYQPGMVFTAGTSREVLLRDSSRQVVRERGLLLVMGVIAMILAIKGSQRFLKPLLELEKRARQIMALDFSARMNVARDDELGRLATTFNQMAEGVQQGRLLRQFVSDSVQAMAGQSGFGEHEKQGTSVELVVLFAGVASFKEIMKAMPADQLIKELNEYLAAMAAIVRSSGGEVDKFIGEKILAVFRCDQSRTLNNAQECALKAARAMKKRFFERGFWKGSGLGVGLAAGPVLSGVLGTAEVRLEFTVIGDTVNLASRLCDLALKEKTIILNRTGRDLLMASDDATYGGIMCQAGEVALKGKAQKVEIFRVD